VVRGAVRNIRDGAPSPWRGRWREIEAGREIEPLMKPGADLLGCQLRPLPLLAGDDDTGGSNTGQTGETENLPGVHEQEILP